jgi:glycosyltransferase involved in cell wall biosynthesis
MQQKQCEFVFTYSAGLLEHSKRYLHPDVLHKVGYIYPVSPPQPEYPKMMGGPFTILVIASRFSDKGLPEAIEAYRILRDRHGSDVQMLLVSHAVPSGYRLPEGIIHCDTPRMSDELKSSVFRSAHVLFIPCYSDSAVPILEACAFGVATLTTRIHHGENREGVTGIDQPPLFVLEYTREDMVILPGRQASAANSSRSSSNR